MTKTERRKAIQQAGLRKTRAEMLASLADAVASGKCYPDGQTIALIDRLVVAAFRAGIEVQSDAIQCEFAEMSIRIAEAENILRAQNHEHNNPSHS